MSSVSCHLSHGDVQACAVNEDHAGYLTLQQNGPRMMSGAHVTTKGHDSLLPVLLQLSSFSYQQTPSSLYSIKINQELVLSFDR